MKDESGNLFTTISSQLSHLEGHFRNLLNDGIGAEPDALSTLPSPMVETTSTPPPTLENVTAALTRMKNRKAMAPNGISNEMLKYAPATAHHLLLEIVKYFWTSPLPSSNKTTDLIPIPKKGDAAYAKNLRGIQVSCKLYCQTLPRVPQQEGHIG